MWKIKEKLIILVFLALIASCRINSSVYSDEDIFEAKNYIEWITVFDVHALKSSLLNSGKPIVSPVFTWCPLLKLIFIGKGGGNRRTHCLVYKIPHKERDGTLKVIEIDNNESCDDVYQRKSFSILENIRDLKLSLLFKKKRAKGKTKNRDIFSLNIDYMIRDGKSGKLNSAHMVFPFINLERKGLVLFDSDEKKAASSYELGRYHSSVTLRKIPGMSIWHTGKLEGKEKREKSFGNLEDSYPDKKMIRCRENGKKFFCDKCKYGWFEAISSNGIAGFCGVDRCGERGWPACSRGYHYSGKNIKRGCYDGGVAGFCEKELSTFCDENGILICL